MSDDSPGGRVTVSVGRLPRMWDDSAVFVANLGCVFFGDPDKTREIVEHVIGFHGYGGRLIPILDLLFRGGGNLLVVGREPSADLMGYFSGSLGLGLPEIEVARVTAGCGPQQEPIEAELLERMRLHPARLFEAYVTDPYLEDVGRDLGKVLLNTHRACREANDKILLNRFLREAGLPVFDGGEAELGAELEERFDRLHEMGYARSIVRASLGASGFGMFVADLAAARSEPFPSHLFREGRVLVHGWVEEGRMGASAVFSPSVQFFCGKDGVTIFDVTDQILRHESIHEGNLSPPSSISPGDDVYGEVLQQAEAVASWVDSTGYRGTASVDFLVFKRNGRPAVHVCEVNARVTGATYPSLLALHFNPGGSWLMRNTVFDPSIDCGEFLATLGRAGRLYEPGSGEGILPMNIILGDDGKMLKAQLLFLARSPQACTAMARNMSTDLSLSCFFDRD